jgi:hypothetical protein
MGRGVRDQSTGSFRILPAIFLFVVSSKEASKGLGVSVMTRYQE